MMINNDIIESLKPMFDEAKEKNLWFYTEFDGGLWFSPVELKELQREGRFVWGPANFKLRDPIEKIYELIDRSINLELTLTRSILEFMTRANIHQVDYKDKKFAIQK